MNDAERLAQYEAGGDSTPCPPAIVPSAEQAWYALLHAAPDWRLSALRHLQSQADVGHACFAEQHRGRIAELEDRIARLEGRFQDGRRY